MLHLRQNTPKEIAGVLVEKVEDYLSRTSLHIESGKKEPLLLPKSDVLRFWLVDGTKIVVRPSGTEPKIKLYAGLRDKHHPHKNEKALSEALLACDNRLDELLAIMKKNLHVNP